MKLIIIFIAAGLILWFITFITNWLSYKIMKNKIISRQKWDLNICCGLTDGGGINADIVKHDELPNFILIDDIYDLPFEDKQFKHTLCSHTIEHVDDPKRFDRELKRVSKNITYLLPPLWDSTAAFNLIEHQWLFLTCKKEHHDLPKFVRLPLAGTIQKRFGQKIKA